VVDSGTGAGFLRVFRFPLPVIHSTNCSTAITIIIQGWYSWPIDDHSNNELSFTPVPKINNNKKALYQEGKFIACNDCEYAKRAGLCFVLFCSLIKGLE
jgi:hypothetical protein